MDATRARRVIVLPTPPGVADSVIADLRAAGHRLRIERDVNAAGRLLAAGEADLVLCAAGSDVVPAIEKSHELAKLEGSVACVVHDLRHLAESLAESASELSHYASSTRSSAHADTSFRARQRALRIQEFLADLLAELLNGASVEPLPVDTDLEDLVERAATIAYSEAWRKDQRLVVNIDDDATRVRADPAKLKRILANLLVNAVRRTPVAGTIAVEATRKGSDCLITVSDSGESVAEDEVLNLLSPADTGDATGNTQTGLGLSVAQRLTEQQGGRMWAESLPARGATIVVLLPQKAQRGGVGS